jgi:hypothetical protein
MKTYEETSCTNLSKPKIFPNKYIIKFIPHLLQQTWAKLAPALKRATVEIFA